MAVRSWCRLGSAQQDGWDCDDLAKWERGEEYERVSVSADSFLIDPWPHYELARSRVLAKEDIQRDSLHDIFQFDVSNIETTLLCLQNLLCMTFTSIYLVMHLFRVRLLTGERYVYIVWTRVQYNSIFVCI